MIDHIINRNITGFVEGRPLGRQFWIYSLPHQIFHVDSITRLQNALFYQLQNNIVVYELETSKLQYLKENCDSG